MNKIKKSLLIISVLCLVLAVTACTEKDANKDASNDGDAIATVNGKPILKDEYDQALAYYKEYVESQYGEGTWEEEARAGLTYKKYYEDYVLDTITYRLLLLDAAQKEGITTTEEEIQTELESFKVYFENDDEYKNYLTQNNMTEESIKEELSNEIMINHYVISKIENLVPSDAELKKVFDDVRMDEKVKASHILVNTEDEAKKVLERLNNGEDFAALAKELSIDTTSGANGGDLDYFEYIKMVKPFSEAAFSMEIGEVSKPVQSDFGYHIIKVTDKIVDEEITVDTEKDWLTDYYKSNKYEDMLKNLKDEAKIVMN